MDLTYLNTFRVVALHRSFTRAAAELGYAQSSVTMQMQKLEQYYEAKLFERSGRGVRLTSAGDELLKSAMLMLELHQQSRESLARQSGGTLTIGTIDSIASYVLPDVIQPLKADDPELSIRIVTGREQAMINRVKEGELDVCLLLEEGPPELDLQWITIREEPLVFLMNPSDARKAREALTLEQLQDTEWIMAEESCNYRSMLERVLRSEGISYRIALELGNPEAIKRCLAAGSGVSLLPRMAAEDEIRSGKLVELPIRHPEIRLDLLLGLRPKKWISQPLRAFIERVRA
ncbi:LysR family transcriptional regulator [Paenibacillus antri]|uniref:LysR family transcriptional regulator n=1 Tax=Paenibacillus antri TaxID=2582848 RepID=A0A5R9GBJ8_9BACL|nr:LysR family transcriptional regulator [Paenibacillus antri]TLS51686.1 LysR family transcriptional regulator [Paenibacillus antri]